MRRLMSTIALAALMAGIATAANATEGWYGRGDVGYSVDGHVEGGGSSFDFDDDWMVSGGIGYGFSNGFRAEGELSYRKNDLDVPTNNETTATSLMANLYYDFNRGGRWQPYVGIGAGYTQVDIEGSDDDSSWAWQAMAGIGYELNDRTTLDVGYRFFRADDLEFTGTDVEYEHQAVTVGIRWEFAPPAPPPPPPYVAPPSPPVSPPPPPAACPTSEFIVYFEWDRSNLNQAALDVIDQAVQRANACNMAAVVAVGHTDTSGRPQYNMGLSERRASVVRDALVSRGVSASLITTQAHGETDLARQTPDNTREPLNRRTAVTITFR